MNISKLFHKGIFVLLSIIMIICCFDQLYMMIKYKNISIETFVLTVFLTGISLYFAFFQKFIEMKK